MSKYYFILCFLLGSFVALQAQSKEELEARKAELMSAQADLKEQVDAFNAYQAQIDGINGDILKLSGWQKGLSGLVGFSLNKSNSWVSSPNPNASSSSLNLAFTAHANKITNDYFWRNKGILNKSWSDVDLTEADGIADDDGLFDNGTVDLLNISSLYGRNISSKIAISALGEINTSLGNFFEPGTFDIGAGVTWIPTNDLVVVIHPLNYHFAFSGLDGLESTGSIGAKLRADYTHTFKGGVAWSSTLTSFVPYVSKDPTLFEYTWINTLSFEVWKGIGVGISVGLRKAEFETSKTQNYYSIGLSYAIGN